MRRWPIFGHHHQKTGNQYDLQSLSMETYLRELDGTGWFCQISSRTLQQRLAIDHGLCEVIAYRHYRMTGGGCHSMDCADDHLPQRVATPQQRNRRRMTISEAKSDPNLSGRWLGYTQDEQWRRPAGVSEMRSKRRELT